MTPPVASWISLRLFLVHNEHWVWSRQTIRILGSDLQCLYLDWITKRLISDVQVTAICPCGCHRLTPMAVKALTLKGEVYQWHPWKVNQLPESGQDTGLSPVPLEGVNQFQVIQFQCHYKDKMICMRDIYTINTVLFVLFHSFELNNMVVPYHQWSYSVYMH